MFTVKLEGESLADVTGLIGQYAHGNEPSHHVTYLYALAGRPERTQELVREIFDTQYKNKPDGLCGNDESNLFKKGFSPPNNWINPGTSCCTCQVYCHAFPSV